MTYQEALSLLHELAESSGLRIKTYCLVRLHCETVPDAIAIIRETCKNAQDDL